MASTALTLSAERWLDEVLLFGAVLDSMGAAVSESFTLPAGLGDVALLNFMMRAHAVDVGPATASTVPRGVRAFILSGDAAKVVDNVGVSPWYFVQDGANALEYGCFFDPDALVLWRQTEILSITSTELDSDATPLGDLQVFAKCVRVRPIEAPARGPVRLVR